MVSDEPGGQVLELAGEGPSGQTWVHPADQPGPAAEPGPGDLGEVGAFALRGDAERDLALLEAIRHLPGDRSVRQLDDLHVCVESHPLPTGSVQMLAEAESRTDLDSGTLDQFGAVDIGAPQRIVPGVGYKGEYFVRRRRHVPGDLDRAELVSAHPVDPRKTTPPLADHPNLGFGPQWARPVPTLEEPMTENGPQETTESSESRQRWVEEVQEALDRTGDALRTAWEATRESRMGALESAKQAAQELGAVIDKGIGAAKERWAESQPADTATAEGMPVSEPPATEDASEASAGAGDVTVTEVVDDSEEPNQT